MLHIYRASAAKAADAACLERVSYAPGDTLPDDAVWVDMIQPTRDEETLVERFLGIEIPTREEMQEIEASSLLYGEQGANYMTARILCRSDSDAPKLVSVSFVLTERALVTVRYDEPRSFQIFASRAVRPGTCGPQPEAILDALVETIIDRASDILRNTGDRLETISRGVFLNDASAAERGGAYKVTIRDLATTADLIANVRESCASLERMLLYLSTRMSRPQRMSGFQSEWRTLVRDVQSIEEHASFLASKVQFTMETTLGLVSIEQGKIIKLFSVVAVVFLPPTLVASSYGMNFKQMPELEWAYGYPMAIVMMLIAAVVPYVFFKWKKWL